MSKELSDKDLSNILDRYNEIVAVLNNKRCKECLEKLILLGKHDIKDIYFFKFWYECANEDKDKLFRTLDLIRFGLFSNEEIWDNIHLIESIPFINDKIKIEGIPPYWEPFDIRHPKWKEYCLKNKASFISRLRTAKAKEANKTSGGIQKNS